METCTSTSAFHIEINLRWIIHLNVKTRTMVLLEENIGNYFHILVVGRDLSEKTCIQRQLQPITIKENGDKLDFIKMRNSYHEKT